MLEPKTKHSAMSAGRSLLRAAIVLGVLVAAGCQSRAPDAAGDSTTVAARRAAPTPPTPPRIAANLHALEWITGTWRGSGVGQAPFYERYRFADDSTLVVESFADSTLRTVSEVTRFALRDSALTSIPGAIGDAPAGVARWYGSALSSDSVRFEPLSGVRNSFTWVRGTTANDWLARLTWPAAGERPARVVSYAMRRTR
jgi:hypothetical protein